LSPRRRPGARAWERFREAARTAGTARALAAAPLWFVRPMYAVTQFRHGHEAPYPRFDLDGLDLHRIGAGDLELVRGLEPGVDAFELERRLAEGLEGRVVRECGEAVYLRWDAWSDHVLPYLGATFRLRPGDHHAALAVTRPDRRGGGLHGRLLAWSLDEARRRGCRRSFGLVAAWNTPSARAVAKPGWSRIGSVGCWTLASTVRYRATGGVRLGRGASFEVADEGDEPGKTEQG